MHHQLRTGRESKLRRLSFKFFILPSQAITYCHTVGAAEQNGETDIDTIESDADEPPLVSLPIKSS